MTEIKRLTDDDIAQLKSGWAKDHECGGGIYIPAIADDGDIEIFARAVEDKVIRNALEAAAAACVQVHDELGGVALGRFVTDFGKHTHMSMAAGAKNCESAIRALIPKE